MQLIGYAFYLAQRWMDKGERESQTGVSSLSLNEQKCYNKIVNELLQFSNSIHCKSSTLTFTSNLDNSNYQIYVIIFRQSESWREVESKLNSITIKEYYPKVRTWTTAWLESIQKMRSIQTQLQDFITEIKKCKEEQQAASISATQLKQLKTEENLIQIKILENKTLLKDKIKELDDYLQTNKIDSILQSYPECKTLIDFLDKNWSNLIIFSELPDEVLIDEKKLIVEVDHKNKELIDCKKEEDILIEMYPNKLFEEIYILEEQKPKEKLLVDSISEYKSSSFTEIQLRPDYYTPAPEMLFDFSFDSKIKQQEKKQNKTLIPTAKQIRLVQLALSKVNEKLSES